MGDLVIGKKLLLPGIVNDDSIAYGVLKVVLEQGADVLLTIQAEEQMSLIRRTLRRLRMEGTDQIEILAMDVTKTDQVAAVAARVGEKWGTLDGLLHSIAWTPPDTMGGNFMDAPLSSVVKGFEASAYSLVSLTNAMRPYLKGHETPSSVVTLTFDPSVAWPSYDWMGVIKAALNSIVMYMARDLGPEKIRVNGVSSGPIGSVAAKNIPGFLEIAGVWPMRAPGGWSLKNQALVGGTVAWLFSELSLAVNGTIVFSDGGAHSMGTNITREEGVESTPSE